MTGFNDDLLRPRDRVFLKPKKRWGAVSILLAVLSAAILTLVVGAYSAGLLPDGRLALAVGVLGAVVLPVVLALRVRFSGPRFFAFVDTALVVVLFTVLGGPTDRALAHHGLAPFEGVAQLVGQGATAHTRVTEVGQGVVQLLRTLTLGHPAKVAAAAPPARPPARKAGAEPTADAGPAPRASGRSHAAARVPAPPAALQATVELAGDEAPQGTLSVLADHRKRAGAVEIPIDHSGRPVTVGVLVDGRVPADFTFDTGADYTAITPALARRLGYDPAHLGARHTFLTAGGPIQDPVVTLGSLAIDDAEVKHVQAVVCTRCPRNLLGRNFQDHFRVEIDSGAGVLRLHRR